MRAVSVIALLAAIAVAAAQAPSTPATGQEHSETRHSWDFRATSFRSKQDVVNAATSDPVFATFSDSSNRRMVAETTEEDPRGAQHALFLDWAAAQGYSFAPGEEEDTAFANWKNNMAKVYAVNTDPTLTWWLSGNQFSHLSPAEFRERVLLKNQLPTKSLTSPTGRRRLAEEAGADAYAEMDPAALKKLEELQAQIDMSVRSKDFFVHLAASQRAKRRLQRRALRWHTEEENPADADNTTDSTDEVPSFVDWTAEGKVTFVKDQGQCGSCWAFVAVAALESMYLNVVAPDATLDHINLSEQQLVSCCKPGLSGRGQCPTCSGCNGGVPYEALFYAAAGIELTEQSYPYMYTTYFDGVDNTCNGTRLVAPDRAGVRSWGPPIPAEANSEDDLISIVAFSPTIVGFYAEDQFQQYAGGVFQPKRRTCQGYINHAMVAVGYDNSTTGPEGRYFLIKNSFGKGWGDQGYIKVRMSGDSMGVCRLYDMNPVIPFPAFQQGLAGDELPDSPPAPPPLPPLPPLPTPPPPCNRRCIGSFCFCRNRP